MEASLKKQLIATCVALAGTMSLPAAAAPSELFRSTFNEAVFPINSVGLLLTTADELISQFAQCKKMPELSGMGRIVCPAYVVPHGNNDSVLFSYLPETELLAGVEVLFNDKKSALVWYEHQKKRLEKKFPIFDEAVGEAVQSPYWHMSLGRAISGNGWWVRVKLNNPARIDEFERYALQKMTDITFGTLKLGVTNRSEIQVSEDLNNPCVAAKYNKEGEEMEFLGTNCFGFPLQAHFTLRFNEKTGTLNNAVLSPNSNATKTLVSDMLKKRYGNEQYCRALEMNQYVNKYKDLEQYDVSKRRAQIKSKPILVYAGTCATPSVFSHEDQFIFALDVVSPAWMHKVFEERKAANAELLRKGNARDERRRKLESFFF